MTTTRETGRAASAVRRTSRRLADGREIIYFDDTPGAPPRTAEERTVGAGPPRRPRR
jgi:hypothetical protein